MTKPSHRPPPKRTPFKQPKPKPVKNYYQEQKYKALRYNYDSIKDEHREIVRSAAVEIRGRQKRVMQDLIAIGIQLRIVKDRLERGQFAEWMSEEFGYRRQWGYETISIAERFANCPIIGQMTETTARILAAPSVSIEVIDAVIEATQAAGKPLAVKEVRAIRDAIQPRQPKQLTGPTDPGTDAIDAEYTVLNNTTYVDVIMPAALAHKLRDAVVTRLFKSYLTDSERDTLLVALDHALRGR